MILTTTSSIEGKVPVCYMGIVGAEVIFGTNVLKDWIAQGTDILGGRSGFYEKTFEDARLKALELLADRATHRGANAVLNIRFDYSVLGAENGMVMVAATGTAVLVTLSEEEKAREAAREKAATLAYLVQIEGRWRGPFSIDQLRDLRASGKISDNDRTRLDDESEGPFVGGILSN